MANKNQLSVKKEEKAERVKLIDLTETVMKNRGNSLLIMFYPPRSSIDESQIELLHTALNSGGVLIANPLAKLDILIHTVGGEPTAAYRLAQVIRDFSEEATFLVPEYAYSGGTLICLSGDTVLLGNHAVLSPIDITLRRRLNIDSEDETPRFRDEEYSDTLMELVAIDHFIKVATQARIEIEGEFRKRNWRLATSKVEETMLCKMIEEMGVPEIAKVFREKNITQEYARELIKCYMFKNRINPKQMDKILRRLVVEAPSHEFSMDYHICADIGLKVEEMSEDLSDSCNNLLKQLKTMAREHLICDIIEDERLPFFQYFPYNEKPGVDVAEARIIAKGTEVPNGNTGEEADRKQREKINHRKKNNN
jgi:hypothetical protein